MGQPFQTLEYLHDGIGVAMSQSTTNVEVLSDGLKSMTVNMTKKMSQSTQKVEVLSDNQRRRNASY